MVVRSARRRLIHEAYCRNALRLASLRHRDSDLDYKDVYLPDARTILLQRVKNTISRSRAKAPGEKNAAGDVDCEIYSLQRYLELVAEGQTVALDMLFAPDAVMVCKPGPEWREIQANSDRLVTRRAASFVRYCRQQANKYCIKGSLVAAARAVLGLLIPAEAHYGSVAKLGTIEMEVTAFAPPNTRHCRKSRCRAGGWWATSKSAAARCRSRVPLKARARWSSDLLRNMASVRCRRNATRVLTGPRQDTDRPIPPPSTAF